MSTEAPIQPTIYLDIQGVVLAPDPVDFEHVVHAEAGLFFAPEAIARIGNTGLRLAWLTDDAFLATRMPAITGGLGGGEILPRSAHGGKPGKVTTGSAIWRVEAIARDQQLPKPFIWVTPQISTDESTLLLRHCPSTPKLIIKTDQETGVSASQLSTIESFAARQLTAMQKTTESAEELTKRIHRAVGNGGQTPTRHRRRAIFSQR